MTLSRRKILSWFGLAPLGSIMPFAAIVSYKAEAAPVIVFGGKYIKNTGPHIALDGAVYLIADYPELGKQLGATFGGDGVTTFAVPNRVLLLRLPRKYAFNAAT